jgi:hypothetical protein
MSSITNKSKAMSFMELPGSKNGKTYISSRNSPLYEHMMWSLDFV